MSDSNGHVGPVGLLCELCRLPREPAGVLCKRCAGLSHYELVSLGILSEMRSMLEEACDSLTNIEELAVGLLPNSVDGDAKDLGDELEDLFDGSGSG